MKIDRLKTIANALDIVSGKTRKIALFPTTAICGYVSADRRSLDIFPHTGDIHNGVSGHLETVCLLSNRKQDTKVRIDGE